VAEVTDQEFALVFDFASEGTSIEYLDKHLESHNAKANWGRICDILGGVADGLRTIHSRNVIHG
jgi:hypothetical protein